MINRGDIKLAIDMVVNAQDDNLFGGEAEYVINTLEDCGNTIAAQAAVIESLKEALHYSLGAWEYDGVSDEHGSTFREANNRCDTPTDSTQILAEVRRAERERVAKMVRDCMFKIGQSSPYRELVSELLDAIRAME